MLRTSSIYLPLDNANFLIELIYDANIISTNDTNFLRIKNAYTGTLNYLSYNLTNFGLPQLLTNNVLDNTVQQIDVSTYLHLDTSRPIRYFEQRNANLYFESIPTDNNNLEILVTYNAIKIHVVQGYVFDDISGLITNISYVDNKTHSQINVVNNAYIKDDDIKFEATPFQLGDRIYNRYIEILFPTLNSLQDIDQSLSTALKANDKLYYAGGTGAFPDIANSRMYITLFEILNTTTDSTGQLLITTVQNFTSESNGIFKQDLSLSDDFGDITANIQESPSGDYFEIFPTYQGDFLQVFLYERLEVYGETYLIIHDIEVYEQLYDAGGYTELLTYSSSQIQSSGFDAPYNFRPIVMNSNAAAFTIQYTMRLYNQTNPSHIIRKASFTYNNPQKYGRFMPKLNIPVNFTPLRIVNKIIKQTNNTTLLNNAYSILSSNITSSNANTIGGSSNSTQTIFIPANMLNLSVSNTTLLVGSDGSVTSTSSTGTTNFKLSNIVSSTVYYGQGDAIVYLSNFDNYIKIAIWNYDSVSGSMQPYTDIFNGSSSGTGNAQIQNNIYFVYQNSSGNLIRIPNLSSAAVQALTNTGTVESNVLFFQIPSANSTEALVGSGTFWLTLQRQLGVDPISQTQIIQDFEIPIYTGQIQNISNVTNTNNLEYNTKYQLLQQKEDEINNIYSTGIANINGQIKQLNTDNTNISTLTTFVNNLQQQIATALGQTTN